MSNAVLDSTKASAYFHVFIYHSMEAGVAFLSDTDRVALTERFSALAKPVTLLYFTQVHECQFCRETRSLLDEVASLSGEIKLDVRVFDPMGQTERAYSVDKIPATIILSGVWDTRMRFFGIPSGYEFVSLIEAIMIAGTGEHGLSDETTEFLKKLDRNVWLDVYVTPTCPWCPKAVQLALRMAFASERVRSSMVEAVEFPHLALQHGVRGVPKTIINGDFTVEGAVPEEVLVGAIREALK